MIGPFCYRNISTDQEFKKILHNHNIVYICFIILGVFTFIFSVLTKNYMKDFMKGFLEGASFGIILGSALLLFKNYKIINNEQKLRESRIKISDERNHLISELATKFALIIILIEVYVIILLSVFINLDTLKICLLIINSFVLLYILSFQFYSKKF